MKSPAFQFYPDDFVGGKVGMMTPEEVGVYVLLLCLDWNQGGFVEDPERLARWCRITPKRFAALWPAVRENFTERDGRLYNDRLEKERRKQQEWREKSSRGGKKSAEHRWHGGDDGGGKGGVRVVTPDTQANGNTPVSSLQSPNKDLVSARPRSTPKALSEKPTDRIPAPVYDHLQRAWTSQAGAVDIGRFRKVAKQLLLGGIRAGQIERAVAPYVEQMREQKRPVKLEWFAEDIQTWIRAADGISAEVFAPADLGMTEHEAQQIIAVHRQKLEQQDAELLAHITEAVPA